MFSRKTYDWETDLSTLHPPGKRIKGRQESCMPMGVVFLRDPSLCAELIITYTCMVTDAVLINFPLFLWFYSLKYFIPFNILFNSLN